MQGGYLNSVTGSYSTILGGRSNQASGAYAIAGGNNARANHLGSFVWADSLSYLFPSTAIRQFSVRSTGGARFVTAVDGTGAPTAGVSLAPGAGAWSTLSDRNVKANITAVDSRSILERVAALPVQEWNYTSQDASVRHIGPMAQDFAAAFGVGENTTTISTVDADGVALAAIQGLYAENEQLKASVSSRRRCPTIRAAGSPGVIRRRDPHLGHRCAWHHDAGCAVDPVQHQHDPAVPAA